MKKQRVIIIGAGAAGLSVAQQLQGPCEVIHLEAQASAGGRVKVVSFSGLILDSGARFLHHKKRGLYAQAKQRKWLAKSGKVAMIMKGRYLPAWRFALFHILPSLQKSKRLMRAFYRNSDPQKTIETLIVEQGMNEATANFFRQVLGGLLGCDVAQVAAVPLRDSFKAAGVDVEQDLISQPLKQPLAELLRECYGAQMASVLLGRRVVEVDYREDEVKVRCANGDIFMADKVVVTVPLAILKRQQIQFTPPLPTQHQQAIECLGMGQGGVLFLRFKQRFWKSGLSQLINVDSPCHFWMPDKKSPVIMAFYVADESDLRESAHYLSLILQTLGDAFQCDAAALLDEHYHENWSDNPAIGGLYSYDRIGSEGARSALQQPVDERLFFAGEATVEGHFATVEGAIASAERVVAQL
ncbi:MAG: FAD-dependent oxidoreductase [Gammaproteobacteria bacterium]|nr:FAD-dependent oxidoreductase [Gammaproteobacteria bacterium]MCF6229563.1 FAD-dependent oxidoreductase [Gammaproteobacteria bacterium]